MAKQHVSWHIPHAVISPLRAVSCIYSDALTRQRLTSALKRLHSRADLLLKQNPEED